MVHKTSIPYYSQINGHIEVSNKETKSILENNGEIPKYGLNIRLRTNWTAQSKSKYSFLLILLLIL